MTLGTGDHIAKLKRVWNGKSGDESGMVLVEPIELVTGEAYHQFEVVSLYGNQGDTFAAILKKVR